MSIARLNQVFGAALVAAVAMGAASVWAQSGNFVGLDDQPTGKIVPIAPGGGTHLSLPTATDNQTALDQQASTDVPKYWIGILLGPVPDPVRAQIDVPGDEGVMVRQVLPGSPASKAGLETFDILLKANDTTLSTPQDLMELVGQVGDDGGEITLDVLRRGQRQSITLAPEARPQPADMAAQDTLPGHNGSLGGAMPGIGPAPQLRMFAPGGASAKGFNLNQMPNGVSVSIQKQNDEPAHITVQRGNDTWEIIGDDPESLAQLPDDVRPFVERMLSGDTPSSFQLPTMPGMTAPGPQGFGDDMMQQQLHRMEQQLQQMRRMLEQDLVPQKVTPVYPKGPDDTDDSESN